LILSLILSHLEQWQRTYLNAQSSCGDTAKLHAPQHMHCRFCLLSWLQFSFLAKCIHTNDFHHSETSASSVQDAVPSSKYYIEVSLPSFPWSSWCWPLPGDRRPAEQSPSWGEATWDLCWNRKWENKVMMISCVIFAKEIRCMSWANFVFTQVCTV
jgi:hypothetical protein